MTDYFQTFTKALSDAAMGAVELPYQEVLSHEVLQYKGIEDGKRDMRKDVNRLFHDFNKATLAAKEYLRDGKTTAEK
jgi:hypothetical protein